jgi:Fur family ferric uptake transcriptional regulator
MPHTDRKHAFLQRQLATVLQHLQQDLAPDDRAVVDAFMDHDRHLAVDELKSLAQPRAPTLDAARIRRVMKLLCELGIARRLKLGNAYVYEHAHLREHHDHLICLRCGSITEFVSEAIEAGQLQACRDAGFEPLVHNLVIRGLCAACATQIPPTRALAACLPGENVEVTDVLGDPELRQRLLDLGLLPGVHVHLLRNDGPVVVEVKGSRIALDQHRARQVITRRLPRTGA